jgi:hypothetical protein
MTDNEWEFEFAGTFVSDVIAELERKECLVPSAQYIQLVIQKIMRKYPEIEWDNSIKCIDKFVSYFV